MLVNLGVQFNKQTGDDCLSLVASFTWTSSTEHPILLATISNSSMLCLEACKNEQSLPRTLEVRPLTLIYDDLGRPTACSHMALSGNNC